MYFINLSVLKNRSFIKSETLPLFTAILPVSRRAAHSKCLINICQKNK